MAGETSTRAQMPSSQSGAQSDLVSEKCPPMPPELYSTLMVAQMPSSQSEDQSDMVPKKRPPMPSELYSALMTAQMPSSQSDAQSDLVPEKRPPMPLELYSALMAAEMSSFQSGGHNDLVPEKHLPMPPVATQMSSSQSGAQSKLVPEKHPRMPPELYSALMAAQMASSQSGAQSDFVPEKHPPMLPKLYSSFMSTQTPSSQCGAQSELVPKKRPPMPPHELCSAVMATEMSNSQSGAQSDLVSKKCPSMPRRLYSSLMSSQMLSFKSGTQSALMPEKRPPMPPELCSPVMAAEMSSPQSDAQSELVPEKHSPMPPELYSALLSEGMENDIIQHLELSEVPGILDERQVKVQVDAISDPTSLRQTETKNKTIISDIIKCAAVQSGDTVLHLLIHNGHDDLAVRVFRKEPSLVKAQNNNLETPLHIAARTGRKKIVCELININSEVVKDALAKENCNGNTALHIAARHRNVGIGRELMKLDPEVAKMVNHEGSAPIHVAVCYGNMKLVEHIMEQYPKYAKLPDSHGRNLFHIAAMENQADFFELSQVIKPAEYLYQTYTAIKPTQNRIDESIATITKQMNIATDREGNTPLHIAAKIGNRLSMSAIYENKLNRVAEKMPNHEGYTPFELSVKQVEKNSKIKDIEVRISSYICNNGDKFTSRWFEDIMAPSDESKWERTQVIGLGAVLITTITFAAAFTIPGGYDQNEGTPILGRTIAYKVFTIANTLSFVLAFISLYTLVSSALVDPDYAQLKNATDTFTASAGFMVLAFALGSYVMLVPVSLPIALIVLIVTMPLGSPYMSLFVTFYKFIFKYMLRITDRILRFTAKALIILITIVIAFSPILLVTFAIFVGILKWILR